MTTRRPQVGHGFMFVPQALRRFSRLNQHHRERQQTKPYQRTQAHAGNHVGRKMNAQINTGQADAKGESGEEARQGLPIATQKAAAAQALVV